MKHLVNTAIVASSLLLSLPSLAQTCPPSIDKTKPDAQYTVNSDNTVTDSKTGLTWMRCSLGQDLTSSTCAGTATQYNWQAALQAAQNANAVSAAYSDNLGHKDWRLPSVAELRTLAEKACYSPAINEAIFPATVSGVYWSSSPFAVTSSYAWVVGFYSGYESGNFKVNSYYVRLVRGGQ